ncbi:MAG: hypothetical protein ACOZCL_15885 [Bacillota bacterium]
MSQTEDKHNDLLKWWADTDKKIVKLLIIMLVLLIFIQALLTNDYFRELFSKVERLEGKAIDGNQTYINRGTIELILINCSSGDRPGVYINGACAAVFDKNHISIAVKDNDIIEISGVGCTNSFEVRIKAVSDNVRQPMVNQTFMVRQNIVLIGKVNLL